MEVGLRPIIGRIPSFIMMMLCLVNCAFFAQTPASNSVSITCHNQINISLPASGQFLIEPGMLVRNRPLDNLIVKVGDTDDVYINCTHVNQRVMVSVIDTVHKISCWGNVLVEDKTEFEIECRDTVISCASNIYATALENLVNIIDNCPDPADYFISYIAAHDQLLSGGGDTARILRRTFRVMHMASGVTKTCESLIYLLRAPLTDFVFPKDTTIVGCALDPTDSLFTGLFAWDQAALSARCDIAVSTRILTSVPKSCTSTKYLREWVITDWSTGEMLRDTQVIITMDTTPFVITGANPTILPLDHGDCSNDIVINQGTIVSACSPIDTSYIRIFLDGIPSNAGDTIRNLSLGMHELIFVLNTLYCNHPANRDTIRFTIGQNGVAPILTEADLWPVTVTIEQDLSVDSLFSKSTVQSCNPVSFLARKKDPRCIFDDNVFTSTLRFCLNSALCTNPALVDSVALEVIAFDNVSGLYSDTVCVWVFPQDKVAPELALNSHIKVDIGSSNGIMIDEGVIISMLTDNSGIIKLLGITGSGTILSGSGSGMHSGSGSSMHNGFGSGMSSGSGSSVLSGSGFPLLSTTFGCDDLGSYIITVSAEDCSGNSVTQQTFLTLTDTSDICNPTTMMATYVAQFMTVSDQEVMDVEVSLNSNNDNRVVISGIDGKVSESSLTPDLEGQEIVLKYLHSGTWQEHITTADLALLQSMVLGIVPITDSVMFYTADINNDGMVSALDIIEMIRIITNQNSIVTSTVDPWFFVLEESSNPKVLTQSKHQVVLSSGDNEFSYRVVKRGDVNESVNIQNTGASGRSYETVYWEQIGDGQRNEVVLTPRSSGLKAIQFAIAMNTASIVSIDAPGFDVIVKENELFFLAYHPTIDIGSIRIEVKDIIDDIRMTNSIPGLAYSPNDKVGSLLRLVSKSYKEEKSIENRLITYPNPFSSQFTVDLRNTESFNPKNPLEVIIYDRLGRVVHHQSLRVSEDLILTIDNISNTLSGFYVLEVGQDVWKSQSYIIKY